MFTSILGIYDESFAKKLLNSSYFEHLSKSVNDTWKELFLLNVTEFFKRALIQDIAGGAVKMLR